MLPKRTLSILCLCCLFFTAIKPDNETTQAQPFGWKAFLNAVPASGPSLFVPPATKRGACATFNIRFNSLGNPTPNDVRDAVRYAADLWGGYLASSEPIRATVVWVPLPGSTLGVGIPNGVINFQGAPQPDVWYPTALANARLSTDLKPDEDDMTIYLTSSANWYTGIDGMPGRAQQDLVSVALHEFGHGVGFASVMGVDPMNGLGSFGLVDSSFFPPTTFRFPKLDSMPGAYDAYLVQNSTGSLLINEANPSAALASLLTGGDLALSAPTAVAAYGGQRPPVHTPPIFAEGTSITHLDDGTFRNDPSNGLMSPFSTAGTAIHAPGPIVMGLFEDMGWPLCTSAAITVPFSWENKPGIFYTPQSEAVLTYQTEKPLSLTLTVFELGGRMLRQERLAPSYQPVSLTLSQHLHAGTYCYRLESAGAVASGKFTIQ